MPFDLSRPSLSDLTECSAALRRLGAEATSMEQAAAAVVRFLYDALVASDGTPACCLVRFYKSHPLADLPPDLQEAARAGGDSLPPDAPCLTLLATAGTEPDWNDRRLSTEHRVIPLPTREAVRRLPMVLQLVRQLGVDPAELVAPDPALIVDAGQRAFNVFYVENAAESPHIPAQEFVQRYGVQSVLGFGGLLPGGELYAIILFTTITVSPDTADLFKPLSLSAKLPILQFVGGPVFDS